MTPERELAERAEALAERAHALARLHADAEGMSGELLDRARQHAVPLEFVEVLVAAPQETHLLFLQSGEGYGLVERAGRPPVVGASVVHDNRALLVVKVGRSPLPGDARTCVYVLAP